MLRFFHPGITFRDLEDAEARSPATLRLPSVENETVFIYTRQYSCSDVKPTAKRRIKKEREKEI